MAFATSNAQTPSLVWAQRMGSTAYDVGWSVTTDAAGNVYTVGHFRGTVDFDPSPATFNLTAFGVFEDIFISKSDANGNFLWAKSIGSTTQDLFDQAQAITYRAGHIYVTGLFSGTVDFDPGASTTNLISVGGKDIFVLKIDINGNFVWAKSMGSVKDDNAYSIATDASQNVYTTGGYEALADFDPGAGTFNLPDPISGSAIFVSKLDMDGNFGWAISLGAGNAYNIAGFSVATDLSGNVYTTGTFRATIDFDPGAGVSNLTSATFSADDIFILKLTSSGSFAWAKSMGSSNEDQGQSIVIDVAGNVVTTGYFAGTVDFDPGAGVFNLTGFGVDDIFISKLDANGNFLWAKQLGGIEEDDGFSVATDAAGNIYTTGFFQEVADFDPGTGIFNLTAVGTTYDIFISKLDANGNFVWATSIGSTGNDYGRAITTDGSGNAIITGNFKLTADFNPGAATLNLTSAGNDDIFIQKLSSPIAALPTITSFTPTSGPIGITVTITGTNFDVTPANNTVKFNGTLAAATSSSTTSITTTVPTGATSGPISVTVAGNTATSATNFTITSTSNQPPVITKTSLFVVAQGVATINLLPLISDSDNNLDLNSLKIKVPPLSDAPASINNGVLAINYTGINFSGTDNITIEVCDLVGSCTQQQLTIEVTVDIVVYNAVSPEGKNPILRISAIEGLSSKVSIYNRWGDEVFSVSDYDNKTRVFAGLSNSGSKLPTGTYFYKIILPTANKTLTGFLSLKY
jgi:CHU_C Type IX secretion signal domain/IPT/TIG domain/Beta-propeller repeat